MGSLSHEETLELKNEMYQHFSNIVRLNTATLEKMKDGEITECVAIVPDGVLRNNLHFYTNKEDAYIYFCFGYTILTSIFKEHLDTFIQNSKS